MTQYALPILHDASEVKTSWAQLAGDADSFASDELDEGFGAGRGSGAGPDDATTAWQTISTSATTIIYECALTSLVDPQNTAGHIIRARGAKSATGGCTLTATLSLYQGTTLIASGSPTVISATAYATLSYTLSAAEVNAITDYTNLRLRFTIVFSAGTARRGRLSALEMETPDLVVVIVHQLGGLSETNNQALIIMRYDDITKHILSIEVQNGLSISILVAATRVSDNRIYSATFPPGTTTLNIPITSGNEIIIVPTGGGRFDGVNWEISVWH